MKSVGAGGGSGMRGMTLGKADPAQHDAQELQVPESSSSSS